MQAEIWYILSKYNFDSGVFRCSYGDKKVEVSPIYESHFHTRVDHPRGAYFSTYSWTSDGAIALLQHLAAAAKEESK